MKKPPKQISRVDFEKRVTYWSNRIGVAPKVIQIRPMKRKWASCSTGGWVMFSKDLLRAKPRFREFVIVHELVHLQVPNHGKLFKNLMCAFFPNWEKMAIER